MIANMDKLLIDQYGNAILYKVDTNRILTCGNFKEQYGSVKKLLGDLYSVSNNLGTVIDD